MCLGWRHAALLMALGSATACGAEFVSGFSGGGSGGQAGSYAGGGSGGGGGAGGHGGSGGTIVPVCGDGVAHQPTEECDDGNLVDGDGCDGSCVVECENNFAHKHPDTFHCYRRFGSSSTWLQARQACQDLGAGFDLAAVTSEEERDFLDNITSPGANLWLGGDDRQTEGTFVWVTGEPWAFDGWLTNEPANASGLEDCVFYVRIDGDSNDGFEARDCDESNAYQCEMTPPGTS